MRRAMQMIGGLLLLASMLGAQVDASAAVIGRWRAWLDCPGGELPFVFEVRAGAGAGQLLTVLHNSPERIPVPQTEFAAGRLRLKIDYYDSEISAKLSGTDRLDGTWRKRLGPDRFRQMKFHARRGSEPRFARPGADGAADRTLAFAGRWSVQFAKDRHAAVGVFAQHGAHGLRGTFLTTLGDYRYLTGVRYGDTMQLSCFDGAHAFLFRARQSASGELRGDFWSSDRWHETFTGRRDAKAALPDAWQLTSAAAGKLSGLRFPDLSGRLRGLDDAGLRGHARLLVVFGSWCPNCKDETTYLVELDRRYRKRGLRIVGLAFELTGELERDTRQLRTYARRHGVRYPLLVAGLSNKQKASQALPLLDAVRSYPTTVFVDSQSRVRAVHTGFSGPGTGVEHRRLRQRFETLIETLLAEGGK